MPYIRPELRLMQNEAANPGELNYALTVHIQKYLEFHGESYRTYNDILGVLTAIQHELYRRKIAPYEDIKIKEYGDVY